MELTASSRIMLLTAVLSVLACAAAATPCRAENASQPCAAISKPPLKQSPTGNLREPFKNRGARAFLTPCPSGSTREGEEGRVATLYSPAWSPDGRHLTFEAKIGDRWVLMIIRANGTGARRLTEPRYTSHSSSWSPDGKLIVFVSDRDGTTDLYRMKADGSDVIRLTNDAAKESSPRWSPDGGRIAYLTNRDGRNEIYSMKGDGSQHTRVTKDALDIAGRTAWTPDGKISFFATEKGKRGDAGEGTPALLWTVRPDGTGLKSIGATPAREYNPSWSPDGRRVAFDAHRDGAWESADGGWEIWVKNSDGSKRRRLTNNSVNDWGPAWSPDGSRIAYCSGMNNKYEIWVMKADGSASSRLTFMVYDGLAPGEKR